MHPSSEMIIWFFVLLSLLRVGQYSSLSFRFLISQLLPQLTLLTREQHSTKLKFPTYEKPIHSLQSFFCTFSFHEVYLGRKKKKEEEKEEFKKWEPQAPTKSKIDETKISCHNNNTNRKKWEERRKCLFCCVSFSWGTCGNDREYSQKKKKEVSYKSILLHTYMIFHSPTACFQKKLPWVRSGLPRWPFWVWGWISSLGWWMSEVEMVVLEVDESKLSGLRLRWWMVGLGWAFFWACEGPDDLENQAAELHRYPILAL